VQKNQNSCWWSEANTNIGVGPKSGADAMPSWDDFERNWVSSDSDDDDGTPDGSEDDEDDEDD
jgi:hypothetical protein